MSVWKKRGFGTKEPTKAGARLLITGQGSGDLQAVAQAVESPMNRSLDSYGARDSGESPQAVGGEVC